MKIILLFLALLLMVIGCDDKQNVYQKGDIVFDAQGFPYYYGGEMWAQCQKSVENVDMS